MPRVNLHVKAHTELGHGFQASLNSSGAQPAPNTKAEVCFCWECLEQGRKGPELASLVQRGAVNTHASLSPSLTGGSPPASEAVASDGPGGGGRSASDPRVLGREVEGLVHRRDILADSGINTGMTLRSRSPCWAGANAYHGQHLLM